jgi:hypothetical protein
MVSRVVEQFYTSIPNAGPEVVAFVAGVEVLYWNGVPIKRAIELNGESQAGSNIDARVARGLDNLTIRPLETSLPPDEIWVNITYRSSSGQILTLNQEWLVHKTARPGRLSLRHNPPGKRAAIDVKNQDQSVEEDSVCAAQRAGAKVSAEENVRRDQNCGWERIRLLVSLASTWATRTNSLRTLPM